MKREHLPASKIRKGLRLSVVEGSFAAIHIQLTGGIFLSGFILYLGATDFQIGLISALPALLTVTSFLAIPLVNWFGNRKPVTVITAGVGRGLFIIPAILILTKVKINMVSVLILIGCFNTLLVIANNSWTSWMSDLVPRQRWGRYFGLRNMVVGGVGMGLSYGGAWLLDIFKKNDMVGEGFGWIFLTAAVASTISAILLGFQPCPRIESKAVRLGETLSLPFRDRKFRKLIFFLAFWHLTSGIASPFFGVHMLDKLHMPYSQAALYGVIAGISGLVFQLFWGKVIDKIHPKPVLQLSYAGVALLPLMWLIARPGMLWPIWIDSFLTGIFWTGVGAALFNVLLGSVSQAKLKESYIAVFTMVTGICGFLSGLLGGTLAQLMANFKLSILGQELINYHVLFACSSVFRIISLFLLARIKDTETPTVKVTLSAIGSYALRRLSPGKGLPLRSLSLWGRRDSDMKNKNRNDKDLKDW